MDTEINLNFSQFSQLLLLLESQITSNPSQFFENIRSRIEDASPAFFHDTWIKYYIQWLDQINGLPQQIDNSKVKRLYMDGCFDLVHSGHFNALRQAKALTERLVIGVVQNEAIEQTKGMTIMSLEERMTLIGNCKWVDEVVSQESYIPTLELLDSVKCSHIAHGDDLIVDGNGSDVYYPFQQANRFKIFKRTSGISTTEIIEVEEKKNYETVKLLNTTNRIKQFSKNNKIPQPNDKIIYIQGAFDIFRFQNLLLVLNFDKDSGHVKFLERAKKEGTFLLVGIYSDEGIRQTKGNQYPILSLEERILNVLASKYVDEIVIGVQIKITENLIKNFQISKVIETDLYECNENQLEFDPYEIPKQKGIYQFTKCQSSMRLQQIMQKIKNNYQKYQKIHAQKSEKLKDYYAQNQNQIQEINCQN